MDVKNIKLFKIIFVGLLLVTNTLDTALAAQESSDLFRKGQVFIELAGGASNPTSPTLKYIENDENILFGSFLMLASQDQNRQLFGAYQLAQLSDSYSVASNGRLGFEYGATDWLGLGASIESTRITVKNAYPYSGLVFYSQLGLFSSSAVSGVSLFELFAYQRDDIKMEPLNTLDFNIGFHLPGNEFFDPYFRLAIGAGSVSDGSILKAGGVLGLRYQIAGALYAGLEAYGNAMTITFSDDSSDVAPTTVQESGGRFMLGVTF